MTQRLRQNFHVRHVCSLRDDRSSSCSRCRVPLENLGRPRCQSQIEVSEGPAHQRQGRVTLCANAEEKTVGLPTGGVAAVRSVGLRRSNSSASFLVWSKLQQDVTNRKVNEFPNHIKQFHEQFVFLAYVTDRF